jgi:hypothetical protein
MQSMLLKLLLLILAMLVLLVVGRNEKTGRDSVEEWAGRIGKGAGQCRGMGGAARKGGGGPVCVGGGGRSMCFRIYCSGPFHFRVCRFGQRRRGGD